MATYVLYNHLAHGLFITCPDGETEGQSRRTDTNFPPALGSRVWSPGLSLFSPDVAGLPEATVSRRWRGAQSALQAYSGESISRCQGQLPGRRWEQRPLLLPLLPASCSTDQDTPRSVCAGLGTPSPESESLPEPCPPVGACSLKGDLPRVGGGSAAIKTYVGREAPFLSPGFWTAGPGHPARPSASLRPAPLTSPASAGRLLCLHKFIICSCLFTPPYPCLRLFTNRDK